MFSWVPSEYNTVEGIKGTGEEKDMVLITGMASGTQML